MSVTTYAEGSLAGASATFTDASNAPADPTTVVARVLRPDGTLLPVTPTHAGLGLYTISFVVDQPGRWTYGFQSSGVVTAALEGILDVTPSAFDTGTNPILTVRQLETLMVTEFTPQQYTAASAIIDGAISDVAAYLGRPLETETIVGERITIGRGVSDGWWFQSGPNQIDLRRAPVLTITAVRDHDANVIETENYHLQPWGLEVYGFGFGWPVRHLYVDYTAGLLAARPDAALAVRTVVARMAQRGMAANLASDLSAGGALKQLSVDGGTTYVFNVEDLSKKITATPSGIPPDEAKLLARYRRKVGLG